MRNKNQNFQRGNAMIYVLIALALFGALTLALSSQNEQADGQDLSSEKAEFYASELIEYAASTKNVIDQMIMTGTDIDELDFINSTSAGFDTPPHIHKLYHPQGGGLNYRDTDSYSSDFYEGGTRSWQPMTVQNTEWTPTVATDVLYSFMDLNSTICQHINKKITGSTTIPVLDNAFSLNALFRENASATIFLDFTSIACPDCEGYPSLCVTENSQTKFVFYNIVAAR